MTSGKKIFNKVLISNRGEIAVRIIRTLKEMGISCVAVHSQSEKDALHVRMSDESYELAGDSLAETYLDIQKIVSIAIHSGCDAVHPGYGFLSENAAFAEAVINAGINFIGPTPDVISLMGNKSFARNAVSEINVPVTSGLEGSPAEILEKASEFSYPFMLKSALGGGGIAMSIVHSFAELNAGLESVSREALNYFGDDTLFVEKFFTNARHIEIQLIADHYGDIIILGERDCSIQRRFQKIIEESPSAFLSQETLEKLNQTSFDIVQHIGYVNAGTIEFLVDENQDFYFLEMNTRIQVEHPLTEMLTGLDLVELQVYVAAGNSLDIGQYEIKSNGHAMEARLYAEDPGAFFIPSPGPVYSYREPSLPGLRIDSSLNGESYILPDYDPLIAKIIFHAASRDEAITGLRKALSEFIVMGTKTNREFLIELLDNDDFLANKINTRFLENNLQKINNDLNELKNSVSTIKILAAWLGFQFFRQPGHTDKNIWKYIGEWRHIIRKVIFLRGEKHIIFIYSVEKNRISFSTGNSLHILNFKSYDNSGIIYELDGEWAYSSVISRRSENDIVFLNGYEYELKPMDYLPQEPCLIEDDFNYISGPKNIKSPLHGKILKINVTESSPVEKGDILFILDAMKTENRILSPVNGCIKELKVSEGEQVHADQTLLIIDRCENDKL